MDDRWPDGMKLSGDIDWTNFDFQIRGPDFYDESINLDARRGRELIDFQVDLGSEAKIESNCPDFINCWKLIRTIITHDHTAPKVISA